MPEAQAARYTGRMKLTELAAALQACLTNANSAAGDAEVTGVASPATAGAGDLVFVEQAERLEEALRSAAGAVIAGEFAATAGGSKRLLIVAHPRLVFVRAAALLAAGAERPAGVHPNAVVHSSARLGKDVAVAPFVTVGPGAVLGDRTRIGACSYIGAGVVLGADCRLEANVTVYPGTRLGDRVVVHAGAVLGSDGFGYVRDPASGAYAKFPQIGRLEIGDDVEIGAGATIDRGALEVTTIGNGTKLDNLVHVAHNVRIGCNVVVAAQTGIAGSSVIEDDVVIGGQVGIADHVVIKRGAVLGAQCGVPSHKVVRATGEPVWGTPARPIKQYLRELAVLARLARREKKPS